MEGLRALELHMLFSAQLIFHPCFSTLTTGFLRMRRKSLVTDQGLCLAPCIVPGVLWNPDLTFQILGTTFPSKHYPSKMEWLCISLLDLHTLRITHFPSLFMFSSSLKFKIGPYFLHEVLTQPIVGPLVRLACWPIRAAVRDGLPRAGCLVLS